MHIFGAVQMDVRSVQAREPPTSLFSLSRQALIFSEGWSTHQNLIWKWNLIALLSGSTVPISLWGPYQCPSCYTVTSLLVEAGAQIRSYLLWPIPPLPYSRYPITFCSDIMPLIPSSTASITLLMKICPHLFSLTPSQSHQQDLCVRVFKRTREWSVLLFSGRQTHGPDLVPNCWCDLLLGTKQK